MSIERRTARGGRDSIDHAPGSHDDIANAVCGGALTLALGRNVGSPSECRTSYFNGPRFQAPRIIGISDPMESAYERFDHLAAANSMTMLGFTFARQF